MTTPYMAAVADMIEPDARDMIGDAPDELVAAASLAVSMKRIADLFDSVVDPAHNAPAIRTRKD